MPDTLPILAVIGCEESGTAQLVHNISAKSESASNFRWTIETKYYTVDVDVQRWNGSSEASHFGAQVEALLLVFNPENEETFSFLVDWVQNHQDLVEGAEIRLCVCNHMSAPVCPATGASSRWKTEGVMRRCWEWCLDTGFEPIQTSTAHPEYDKRLGATGSRAGEAGDGRDTLGEGWNDDESGDEDEDEDEDPQGVPRVLEALHSHLWPGLLRKGTSQTTTISTTTTTTTTTTGAWDMPDHDGQDVRVPMRERFSEETSMPPCGPSAGVEPDASMNLGCENEFQACEGDQENEDQDLEIFADMLQQMQAMRQDRSEGSSQISDADRRKRAEDLTFKLMAMMGTAEDDDA